MNKNEHIPKYACNTCGCESDIPEPYFIRTTHRIVGDSNIYNTCDICQSMFDEYGERCRLEKIDIIRPKIKKFKRVVLYREQLKDLKEFTEKLVNNQKPLDAEISKLVRDNFWDMVGK